MTKKLIYLIKVIFESIKTEHYYWKSLRNDILNYTKNCSISIRNKGGIAIKAIPKGIITKGPYERYVIDGWQLHRELKELTGFPWLLI